MIIPKLAFKNIYGAGLRTWLNVIALSFSYVAIIALQGMYSGMTHQMETSTINAQYGGGQYWQSDYDPYDPLTLDDAHTKIPSDLANLIADNKAVPILFRQGTLYPNGRFQNVLLKGIEPNQTALSILTSGLAADIAAIPALIGSRMAKSTGLNIGDYVTVRWRDANNTFDANEIKIVEIMKTDVPEIDNGQLWIPIEKLYEMTALPGEATMVVLEKESQFNKNIAGWQHKDMNFLLKDLHAFINGDNAVASIFYIVLLLLAMLSIFDTQILSIFRRRKEMGTLMALGMTRAKLIQLFTLEGAFYAVFAAIAAAIYGTPLLAYIASVGMGLPENMDDYGYAISDTIYPSYPAVLIIGTILLVCFITTIVSYLPARRIAKLKPTDALRGKLT